MTLVKFNNRNTFPALVDRFFQGDPFFNGESNLFDRSSLPAVNIRELDNAFEVALIAPGRKREDFKVQLHEQLLSISAEAKTEKAEKDAAGKYSRREFSIEKFERSFTLPEHVAADEIKASYEAGVLTIHIPKLEVAKNKQPRLIEIG